MRILVIGPSFTGALPQSYARAFERLGAEVFHFDDDRALFRTSPLAGNRLTRRALRGKLWGQLNRTTLEIVATLRPALVFAVRASYLDPDTVQSIRTKLSIPIVNHYPDNPYCGVPLNPRAPSTQRRNLTEVLRQYTGVWIWEKNLVERLRADGVTTDYLPFGVDPELYFPQSRSVETGCDMCRRPHDISFVGTSLQLRRRHVEAIRRHSVSIWGESWPRSWSTSSYRHFVHGPVYGLKAAAVHSRAKVSLNIVGDLNRPGHNMRTFEVPACGGVMLSRFTDEQNEFFPENVAAAYYRTPEELDDKLESLLKDRELRYSIGREAARRAAYHTYDMRAAHVLRAHGFQVPEAKTVKLETAFG